MLVTDGRYGQHAGPGAQHGRGQGRAGVELLPLQAPGDGERFIATADHTQQLAKLPLVYRRLSKRERNYFWWF